MRKLMALWVTLVLLCGIAIVPATAETPAKISIVTTTFPIYDWVRQITAGEENIEITMLMDSGIDLHNYDPTAQDILKIATCDLFIYVGGESDDWVEHTLYHAAHDGLYVINLMASLGNDVLEEEFVEGMEEAEETDDHGDEDGEAESPDYDEHVWLSLRNAQYFVRVIAHLLETNYPERADRFESNAEKYIEKIQDLDMRYYAMAAMAQRNTLLFGDRFPFLYLVKDYGLNYYAAFKGCSAESEASFETIIFLAGKVDELELPAVLTIEGTNNHIAETIVQNTGSKDQKVLTLDSMQSVTAARIAEGADYLDIMEANLAVLEEALN